MEWLIGRGVPQRSAHEVIGGLVRLCEERGCRLADLKDEDFAAAHPALEREVRQNLGVEKAIRAFRSYGSTAPAEVGRQLEGWRKRLHPDTAISRR